MKAKREVRLRQYPESPEAGYLELRDHPHVLVPGISKRSIVIDDLIDGYQGPWLVLDFNAERIAIGIEIVYRGEERGHKHPTKGYMRLKTYESDDTWYLELRDHPNEVVHGIIARTVRIHELIKDYEGPSLALDFDNENRPIGIEILYPMSEGEES